MIKLLKNANVYAPEKLGKKDILIEGEKILLMQDTIEGYEGLPGVETYDLEGKTVVPAYIDMHVHITGGGGEQGPASRVPESQLSEFLKNGITTVVGLLGTDGVTRSVENLVAKARALTEEGMTVYTLTSSYGYPPTTLTGSVERDIILVPPMIGVKVAVSDHRSSNPGGEELIALATAARRAGLLSNTPGLVTMHMGDGEGRLDPVFYVLDHSDVPAKNLLPTHILRNPGLIDAGADVLAHGVVLTVLQAADVDDHIHLGCAVLDGGLGLKGLGSGVHRTQREADHTAHRDAACHVLDGLLHIAGVDADRGRVVCDGLVAQGLDLGPCGLRLEQGVIDVGQDLFSIHVFSS